MERRPIVRLAVAASLHRNHTKLSRPVNICRITYGRESIGAIMSRTLKWILVIVGVLVVLAIVGGATWAWQNRAQLMSSAQPLARQQGVPNQQPFRFGQRGFNDDG